jgi:hypothetical protein
MQLKGPGQPWGPGGTLVMALFGSQRLSGNIAWQKRRFIR